MLADPQKFTSRKCCHRTAFQDSLNSVHYEREGISGQNDATKLNLNLCKRCCREQFRDLLDSVYYEREIVSLTKNERKIQK